MLYPKEWINVKVFCRCGAEYIQRFPRENVAAVLLGEERLKCGVCGEKKTLVMFLSPVVQYLGPDRVE